MKIFPAQKIREWDKYTIEYEPVSSTDLMERACRAFVDWFVQHYPSGNAKVAVVCGPGNNGGDGLGIARILNQRFYDVEIFIYAFGEKSEDFESNMRRLPRRSDIKVHEVSERSFPDFQGKIVIDALLGSGLSRPLEGKLAQFVERLNKANALALVSVDIPSGMFANAHTAGTCIHADRTFSFETPKLAFFFAENHYRTGAWHYASIGLHPRFYRNQETPFHYLTKAEAAALLRPRHRYDHKGTFGHAFIIAGEKGKIGAAVLAVGAALRAGAGLVSCYVPECGYAIMQQSVPEAMCLTDEGQGGTHITQIPADLSRYNAIGCGPGLGMAEATAAAVEQLIKRAERPMVVDADMLNILAKHKKWLEWLPQGSILTPHPKEFERLFGEDANDFARNEKQRQVSERYGIIIVLKGAHSCISFPDGSCWFNSSGNPGMGTGGAGDVLTGILCALLAQKYAPEDAARLGVYLHGLAGDLAAEQHSQEATTAGRISEAIGDAFKHLWGNRV